MEKALGVSYLGPTEHEQKSRENFRLSCCAARDLEKLSSLKLEDIQYFRSTKSGVPPKNVSFLTGKILQKNVNKGDVFIQGENIL